MSVVLTVGVSLSLYAWLLCLISTALPLWTYQKQEVQYQYGGLWKNCTVYNGNADCKKITEGWIHTVQAFMIIGFIVLFLSVVCGCLRLKDDAKSRVAMVSTLAVLIGGFMEITATIVYGVKNADNSSQFSAGFYLSIISALVALLAALLFIAFRRTDGYIPLVP